MKGKYDNHLHHGGLCCFIARLLLDNYLNPTAATTYLKVDLQHNISYYLLQHTMASSSNPLLLASALLLASICCTAGFQSSLFTGGLSSFRLKSHSSGTPTHLYSKIPDERLQPPLVTRRQFYQSLPTSALVSFLIPYSLPPVASADGLKLDQYTDNTYGFQLSTPSEWIKVRK